MRDLLEIVERVRETGDAKPFLEVIPYARFIGLEVERRDGEIVTVMPFKDHLVGNAVLPALHGGTTGALLETAAIVQVFAEVQPAHIPKTINITVEYLRSARALDTFATATVIRHGRRLASVRAEAWQEDRDKPVAAANAHFLIAP